MPNKLIKTEPVLCLDPGPVKTGVVIFDGLDVLYINGSFNNEELIKKIVNENPLWTYLEKGQRKMVTLNHMAIENIQFQGRTNVGQSAFNTAKWVGRFVQAFGPEDTTEISRKAVIIFTSGRMVKKKMINQGIKSFFPPTGGGTDPYKGIKSKPGPLYGLSNHTFSALGVGLTFKYAESGFNFTM